MHNGNVKNKNWVGLFLVLILSMIIIGVSDVSAAEFEDSSCPTSIKAKITLNYKDDGDGELKNIPIELGTGKYSIWLVSGDKIVFNERDSKARRKQKIEAGIADPSSLQVANEVSGSFKVKHSQIKQFSSEDDTYSDFYLVIMYIPEEGVNCDYWMKARRIEYSEDVGSGPIDLTDENKEVCAWANDYAGRVDARMSTLIKKALAPCFDGNSYNFTAGKLEKIKKTLIDFYEGSYKKYLESEVAGATKLPDMTDPWVKVDDPTLVTGDYTKLNNKQNKSGKTKMLTCNAKDERTYQYMYYDKDESETAMVIRGDGSAATREEKNVKACTTTCREELSVSFGPPKAVIAGQCFTYEVEVKSKVTCVVSDINFDDFPDINDYLPCAYKARCVTSSGSPISGYEEQAGPSEDFDACMNTCDAGQYTQECVDECYAEVYGKDTKKVATKKTSKEDNIDDTADVDDTLVFDNVIDVNDFDFYTQSTLALNGTVKADKLTASSVCPSNNASVAEVYNYVQNNVTGTYTSSGGTITYTPKNASCRWDLYGYSYFRDMRIAARTVCNDQGKSWTVGSTTCGCTGAGRCYPARGYHPVNGFKRAARCSETCSWIPLGKSDVGKACYYSSKEQGEKDFMSSVLNYTNALEKCINNSITNCNKETTSTYTMSVNKDTTGDVSTQICDGDNYNGNGECLKWNASHDKINKYDNIALNDNSILKYIGGSCAADGNKNDMYHTILTFPGAWINNKNGEVVYKKPTEEKWYTGYSGNYCTPLTAKNVNANWWVWMQYKKAGAAIKDFNEWSGNKEKDIIYNIFSKIEKFGKYDWNFDVSCFYAINDTTPYIPDGPGDDGVCDPAVEICDDSTTCVGRCETGDTPDCAPDRCDICVGSSCGGDPSDDPACVGDRCTTTDADGYTSKSITTKNLFPSTKTSSLATEKVNPSRLSYVDKMAETTNSRRAGFNWSVYATNLSVAGYPVTPSSLVTKIESTSAYTEDELDYDLTLTAKNIRAIKNESKDSDFSYTSFDTGVYKSIANDYEVNFLSVKDDVGTAKYNSGNIPNFSYYKSNFIRNNTFVDRKTKIPAGDGLKCNNLKSSTTCDLLSEYTASDAELASFIKSAQ